MSLIPQPQAQSVPKQKARTIRFEISSLDQSVRALDSSHFRWTCPFPIREITELSLVSGTIPSPTTNIDATQKGSWNSFSFRIGAQKVTIRIPPGLYEPSTLHSTLTNLLNEAAELVGSENVFVVDFAPQTERLRIRRTAGTDEYGFLFASGTASDILDQTTRAVLRIGTPALVLGFVPGRNELDVDGTIIAPNCLDLGLLTNRIYLYMNYDTTQNLQAYTRGLGRNSPSAIIYMDDVRGGRKYLNKETYIPLIVTKTAAISRIHAIDILFEDFFGNAVNFGNREVSLILEAVCLF
jgi:hypothetical protein